MILWCNIESQTILGKESYKVITLVQEILNVSACDVNS